MQCAPTWRAFLRRSVESAILCVALVCGPVAVDDALTAQQSPRSVDAAPLSSITTPEQALGARVGADGFLATYSQLVTYWRRLASESDRLRMEQIGTSSYGQPMWIAVISSPANLERAEQLRGTANRLARARGLDDDAARALCEDGRAVVWIDAGMHATESVAAQNILELVYRMVSGTDAETKRILDEVILLVCPANPDGMEMIASAYMATKRVGRLPVLYQRYIGHDNNRDHYACNQLETKAIGRTLYRRWNPQIVCNHHQTAPRGTVIFTPPFRDPFNYNFDPMVVRGIDWVSAHITNRFAWEGKPGAISRSGASYSTWWNGGLRTTAYFHNMIGILTESFGSPNPTTLRQPLSRRLPFVDYPDPVATQKWHARQTIEYLQTVNYAILDLAARYRRELLFNIYQMGRNSIRRGSEDHWTPTPKLVAEAKRRDELRRGANRDRKKADGETGEGSSNAPELPDAFADPALRDARGYVLPASAVDFTAAVRLVQALRDTGVEVHVVEQERWTAEGHIYPRGSFVVRCAQAFRPHVRDMFEPQWHPDDVDSGGDPVRPYDSAGWTLAMQLGVEFERLFDAVPMAGLQPLDPDPTQAEPRFLKRAPGAVSAGAASAAIVGYVVDARDIGSYRVVNRLLAAGDVVTRVSGDRFFVRKGSGTERRLEELARSSGLTVRALDAAPPGGAPLTRPRIGLLTPYGGNMATGWSEWLLKQFEFEPRVLSTTRILAGGLRRDFDVLMFHTGLPSPRDPRRVQRALRRGRPSIISDEDLAKMVKALPPFEDWSDVGDRRARLRADTVLPVLRDFLDEGGRVLAVGNAATAAVRLFELDIEVGLFESNEGGERKAVGRDRFYIPGSLVRLEVDKEHPLAVGSPSRTVGMFRRSPVFTPAPGAAGVTTLVRYAAVDTLASGWAIGAERLAGKAGALSVEIGKGRVDLFPIDAMYRGQPYTTARLVFNALLVGR